MNEYEAIKIKFQELYKNRPSAIRTTLFFGPVGWVLRLIGTLLFFTGVGLLIATGTGKYLFDLPDTDHQISNNSEAYQNLVLMTQGGASLFCLVLGLLLWSIGRLCRRIVNRNIYILELEELFEDKKEEQNKNN